MQKNSSASSSALRIGESSFWQSLLRPLNPPAWREDISSICNLTFAQARKNLIKLIPIAAIYYLLLAPIIAMPLYNMVLFHPVKSCPNIDNKNVETIRFPSANGNMLSGWYFHNPTAKYTILVSHGNGGNISHRLPLAHLCLSSGASVFMYDYQGYGNSAGSPSLENICADGLAAYQYLRQEKKIDAKNIIIFGESLGSGVACRTASTNPCAGLILQSAYTSISSIGKKKFFWLNLYPDFLFPSIRLDSENAVRQVKAPVLIVHGMQDRLIPASESDKLAAAANNSKRLVKLPDAAHNDIYDINTDIYRSALTEFIDSLNKASR